MYISKGIKIATLLIMTPKVDRYDRNPFPFSESLDDLLASDGERLQLKQEKPDVIRYKVFVPYSVLYRTQVDT